MSDQSKRILIATGIFYPDIGGPASYGRLMATELSKKSQITLLAYSDKTKYPEDKAMPFKVVRVWRKIPKPFRHLIYFLKLLSLARKHDVIFSLNAVSAGVPAAWASKLLHKKLIVKIVGDYSWEMAIDSGKTFMMAGDFQKQKRSGRIARLHKYQVDVCKRADLVIVPSTWLFNMVRGWGISPEKIKVIYNGVDFKEAEMTREEARKSIGIVGNIIISVGRLLPFKGFRMLIKILPRLFEINQFFRLVIVGDGPDRPILEAAVRNLRLDGKVYIVGKKTAEELAVYFKAADIFILNTGHEGFSHTLLEAMTAGVSVITTGVGGNTEIIKQGENGFMIKYNDEFNLIEAIRTIWHTKELRERFIEEGKKTVEKFSMEKMVADMVKIFETI